jgi:hypothetical protein
MEKDRRWSVKSQGNSSKPNHLMYAIKGKPRGSMFVDLGEAQLARLRRGVDLRGVEDKGSKDGGSCRGSFGGHCRASYRGGPKVGMISKQDWKVRKEEV